MARKKVQPCRGCGKPIPFPEKKPDAIRASRPKHCSVECRFWPYVDKRGEDECWPWLGGKHHYGYGMLNVGNGKK